MFTAIAVDDEKTSLQRVSRLVQEDTRIKLMGTFLDCQEALEYVSSHQVDLVFLDIEMPEIDGLRLAEEMREADPYLEIIYITAYHQYALEAFHTYAIGYLLKPLNKKDFTAQIDVVSKRYRPRVSHQRPLPLTVTCFGGFQVRTENEIVKWKTNKAEELFALLIYYQGRGRSRETLIDLLWPDLEFKKASNLFRVTCTYLRGALSQYTNHDLLKRELSEYYLDIQSIVCDLFAFRHTHHNMEKTTCKEWEKATPLYQGRFLENKTYDWAEDIRVKLEKDYILLQERIYLHYRETGQPVLASQALETIVTWNPFHEATWEKLIDYNIRVGEITKAVALYHDYAIRLQKELQTEPSKNLMDLVAPYVSHSKNNKEPLR
jgi:two-component SAPR family response regulator